MEINGIHFKSPSAALRTVAEPLAEWPVFYWGGDASSSFPYGKHVGGWVWHHFVGRLCCYHRTQRPKEGSGHRSVIPTLSAF